MKVYVVQVTPEASFSRVSQEAYKTFDEAKQFIESRFGNPRLKGIWKWLDDDYTEYEIFEVTV